MPEISEPLVLSLGAVTLAGSDAKQLHPPCAVPCQIFHSTGVVPEATSDHAPSSWAGGDGNGGAVPDSLNLNTSSGRGRGIGAGPP